MAERVRAEQFDLERFPRGTAQDALLTFDTAEGIEGMVPLRVVRGAEEGPTLLVLAAVHGDEYDGVRTVIELCGELRPEGLRGTTLLVPRTNVPAYEDVSRTTPLDGCNLAREFPGDPHGSYTQRLAHHLDQALLARADFLLDLHSAGMETAIPTLVGYYHNDESETGRRARAAAEAFGMDVVWAHPLVVPGRTVSAATERGIPWLYTETSGGRRVDAEGQRKYKEGAYRLMHHLGMLLDPDPRLLEPPPEIRLRLYGDGNFDVSMTSEAEGFFIPQVKLLDEVRQGDLIGSIRGLFGETLLTLTAPGDGVVVGLRTMPLVRPGGVVCAITGKL